MDPVYAPDPRGDLILKDKYSYLAAERAQLIRLLRVGKRLQPNWRALRLWGFPLHIVTGLLPTSGSVRQRLTAETDG